MAGELLPLAVDELCSTKRPYKEQLWGPGPWVNEPDVWRATDKATGLPCAAVRNELGVWCGYVGVGPEHPWYEVHRSDDRVLLLVHGGLSFSDHRDDGPRWWFGFDCGHGDDYAPEFQAAMRKLGIASPLCLDPEVDYRTLRYTQVNCALLAYQLGKVSRNPPPDDAVEPVFLALASVIPRKELEPPAS